MKAAIAVAAVPALIVAGLFGTVLLVAATPDCGAFAPRVEVAQVAGLTIAGHSGAALERAAGIMNAAAEAGLPVKAQVIGVMVAIVDSQLLDPLPGSFFAELAALSSWSTLDPAIAANTILGNADPAAYRDAYPTAQAVVAGLSKETAAVACDVTAPGAVSAMGWGNPATGLTASVFGYRSDPFTGKTTFHSGEDIAAVCGTPIYAAAGGVVIRSGTFGGYGGTVDVDHGSGVVTRYAHMYLPDIFVRVGDQVFAGENIAKIGNTGRSTGCHLHFEVRHDGAPQNPTAFLTQLGVRIGG